MSLDASPATDAAATADASWAHLARRYLSMALRYDYLSNGRGHQQSHRVVHARLSQHAKPEPTRHETSEDDGSPALDRSQRDQAPFVDSERRYLAEVACKPRLTSREEYCLVARMRCGDRAAYDALIEANLGLVVMYARRYQRPGLPLLDLIAEGNFGLMSAADRFDPELGCRFATYAKWWVRKFIQRALPRLSSVVRLPPAHVNAAVTVADSPAVLQLIDNAVMAGDDDDGGDTDALRHGTREAAEPGAATAGASLRRDVSHETSDTDVLESIAIDPEDEPPNAAMAAQRLKVLKRALESLSARDRIIVSARYALDDDCVTTLGELALRFDLSTERIRQIESAAIKKLAKALSAAGESADSLL